MKDEAVAAAATGAASLTLTSCAYSTTPASYIKDRTISPNTLTCSGEAITDCAPVTSLPAGLTVDPTTCEISGTPSVVVPATNYVVVGTNSAGSVSATVNMGIDQIVPTSCTYTYDTNPVSYTKGTAITPNTLNCAAGSAVTSCSVSPSLPAGLNLGTNCTISGTPTALSGSTTYAVTVTNAAGSSNASIKITVADVAPSSCAYASTPVTYARNRAITANTVSCSGGPLTGCTMGASLPAGLSLNSTNCTISGTPTANTAAANYTATASNTGGSANATANITVATQAPSGCSYASTPVSYPMATAITANTLTCTGGSPVTSCSPSATLPNGLNLAADCTITGTPTATSGATTYTMTVGNAAGSTTAPVNITITALPIASVVLAVKGGSPSSIAANGTATTILQATVRDSSTALVSGASVTLNIPANGGTTTGTATTNGSGIAEFTVTSSTVSGSYNYTATAGGVTSSAVGLTFTQATQSVTLALKAGSPQMISNNGSSTTIMQATVKDYAGVVMSGRSVTINIPANGGTIATNPATTDGSGIAEFTLTSSTTNGNFSYTATSGGVTSSGLTITFTLCVGAALTNAPFASGGGATAGDPYMICTPAQLNAISNNAAYVSSYFKLAQNVDMNGVGVVMIGDSTNPFKGSFDGAGYQIQNVNISTSQTSRVGLFRQVQGCFAGNIGVVKDLTVTFAAGGGVTSTSNTSTEVGGMIGYAYCATLTNVHVVGPGTVLGLTNVGGLAGRIEGINNTHYANVTGSSSTGMTTKSYGVTGVRVGGFVGYAANYANFSTSHAKNGTVTYITKSSGIGGFAGTMGICFATVDRCYSENMTINNIQGTAGGFAGTLLASSTATAQFTNLYSKGGSISVNSATPNLIGGFVGTVSGSAVIDKAYSTTQVNASGSCIGGFLANASGANNTVSNSFFDTAASGQSLAMAAGCAPTSTISVTGQTATAMTTTDGNANNIIDIYDTAGWSTGIWNLAPGGYPTLK